MNTNPNHSIYSPRVARLLERFTKGISSLVSVIIVIAILILALAAGLTLLKPRQPSSSTSSSSYNTSLTTVETSITSTSISSSITSSSLSSATSSTRSSSSYSTSSSSSSTTSENTTSVSTTQSSLGGVTLQSYGDNAYDAIYDSVNGYIYALISYPYLGIQTQLIDPSNGTITDLSGYNGGSVLGYNPSTGNVYELQIEGDIGCGVGIVSDYSGNYSTDEAGLSGSSFVYDSVYHYFAFAQGALNDDGLSTGDCAAGLFVWGNNSTSIPTGPEPKGNNYGSGWYGNVPALASNSINGEIYVPVLNESDATGGPSSDATYFYTVNGYSVLPNNFTVSGYTRSLVFDSSNQYLYAEQFSPSNNSTSLMVINPDTGSILGTISLSGNSPIVFDPSNAMIYVFERTQIREISGTQVVHQYDEPTSAPSAAIYDSSNNALVDFYPGPTVTSHISNIAISMTGNGTQFLSANAQINNSTDYFTQGQTIDVQIVLKASGSNVEIYSYYNSPQSVFAWGNRPFMAWDVPNGGELIVNIYFYSPWISYNGTVYIELFTRS